PDFGFGPLSDNSTIKQVENLECRPCGLHGYKECPKGHFKCGNEISI
ncbi:MAG: heptosyltransferase-2, partial [Crocinitomicaceae bacterium]